MNKLCIFVFVTLGGYLGWFAGDSFGFGTAFVLSSVGSILGVFVGWKVAQKFLS